MQRRLSLTCICWLCASWLGMTGGCGRQQPTPVAELPGLDPDAAVALAEPHSPACATFLRAASADRLLELRAPLLEARLTTDGTAAVILDLIDAELADARGLVTYREESAFLASLPDSTARFVLAARREADETFAAADPDIDTKLVRIGQLQATLLRRGDTMGALRTWSALATLEHRRGRTDRAQACRRDWVDQSARLGCLDEQCRGYGQVLMGRMSRGWSPGERDTLRDLTDRAVRAGLARAASSLASLAAYDAYNSGHLFMARTIFQDAIAIGTRLNDPKSSLPAMVFLSRMYAAFECWDQVSMLAARAALLLDADIGEEEPSAGQRLTRLQLRNLAAKCLAAARRVDEAHAEFAASFADARALPYEEASFVCRQWVDTMIDQDRPDLAAVAIAATDSVTVARGFENLRARTSYWRAWLAWRRGDAATATHELVRFEAHLADEPEPNADLEFRARALRVRLEANRDRNRALATLLDGWRALQARVRSREQGTEIYLDLGRNPHLRWVAQELVADQPELGYGLELLWREAMLARTTPLAEVGDLLGAARARAVAARRHLAATDAVHCLYRVGPRAVTRWTADGTGVIHEALTAPADSLRRRTTLLLASLSTDPGTADAAIPVDIAADLAALARDLLPARCLTPASAPRRLVITGDGFLTQFPFASLNVGPPDRYQPLVATTTVGWVRHGLAPVEARGSESVQVVGDPTLDPATRRRFALAADLPGARTELRRVATLFPGREAIAGTAATRDRVREVWDTADVFYFVGHAISDVQVPFAAWLPLGAGADSATYPGLGMHDILGQRFARCRVVVLSGCATGRPYVDGLSTAPSLGDAFLDAGADATVQTLWRVRDESALMAPERIVAAWRDQGLDLASALAAEQRRVLVGPAGIRHPFAWAAWTVEMGGAVR